MCRMQKERHGIWWWSPGLCKLVYRVNTHTWFCSRGQYLVHPGKVPEADWYCKEKMGARGLNRLQHSCLRRESVQTRIEEHLPALAWKLATTSPPFPTATLWLLTSAGCYSNWTYCHFKDNHDHLPWIAPCTQAQTDPKRIANVSNRKFPDYKQLTKPLKNVWAVCTRLVQKHKS